jgi:hypothetical protein
VDFTAAIITIDPVLSVSVVLEESSHILKDDSIMCSTQRFDQCLPATGLGFAKDALYLAESLLYSVLR